jgi:serine/threonine protein kinase/WD40 repeat protein
MSHAGRPAPGTSSTLREACADLVRRLRAGEPAAAEEYIASFPALADDTESAVELIYTEFAACEELGRPLDEPALLRRFPQWAAALRRQLDIHRLMSGGEPEPTLPTPEAADGQRWGLYEIIRPLGHGGMSAVYLATHVELGRLAALKILNRAVLGKGATLERFRAEVRSAAAIGHPGIVQLYELGELPDGRPFAAFEYVEGGSLRDALEGRPRPAREAAELVRRLAESIDRAHKAGIVHCDLTPANVLLTRDGSPKIADFGLSRVPRPLVEPAATNDSDDERAGLAPAATSPADGEEASGNSSIALAGTPGYMAPERIERPELATPAADLYGLGAIFYELLTGRPPHVGATPLETLRQARDFDPPSPRSLSPNIPRDLATICQKCLAREPARRYADAAALADDLRRFLAGEPIAARPVGTLERSWKWAKRRPGLASALATSALALAVLAVGGTWYSIELNKALDLLREQQTRILLQTRELDARVDRQRRDLFTLQLNQAEALLERAPHQSRRLLENTTLCPPDLRDYAWGLMMRRASQERRTLLGHTAPVVAAVVGPGGNLVTAAADNHVFRWYTAPDEKKALETKTAPDGKPAVAATAVSSMNVEGPSLDFPVDTADAELLVLSPDGARLAASGADGSLRVFVLGPTTATKRVPAAHEKIVAITFFSDGKWLATVGEEGVLRLWDPTVSLVATIEVAGSGEATALAASPTDGVLAVGLIDGRVKLIDANGAAAEREIAGAGGAAIEFAHDGKTLYTSSLVDGRVTAWNLATLEKSATVELPGEVLRSFCVSRSGNRMALATAAQLLRVVDRATGATVGEYRGHADRIGAPVFLDDDRLASASDDRTVKLWDVPGRRYPPHVDGDDFKTLAIAYAPDGRRMAVAGVDGSVRIVELGADGEPSGAQPIRLEGHSGPVTGVRFLADGKRLVTSSEDGSARLWNPADPTNPVRRWEHPDLVLDLAIESDGLHFWTAANDGVARRFHVDQDRPKLELKTGEQPLLRVASPSATSGRIVTLSRDGVVAVWDFETSASRPARTFRLEGRAAPALAISSRGEHLAAGTEDGHATVWSIGADRKLHDLAGHTRGIYDMAFCGDGKLLATASGGRGPQSTGEVKLWDVATGQAHATLEGATAPLAFRPDDRVLAAGNGSPRRVALWIADLFGE